jgi:hypothetical protein
LRNRIRFTSASDDEFFVAHGDIVVETCGEVFGGFKSPGIRSPGIGTTRTHPAGQRPVSAEVSVSTGVVGTLRSGLGDELRKIATNFQTLTNQTLDRS